MSRTIIDEKFWEYLLDEAEYMSVGHSWGDIPLTHWLEVRRKNYSSEEIKK